MSYSPEAYEKADMILSGFRLSSAEKQLSRTAEIYKKFPEFEEIDKEITDSGITAARLALKQGSASEKEYDKLSKKLTELEEKKVEILTKNGYPADYMSSVHNCPHCKDTGFVDGNMCICYRTILSKYDLDKISGKKTADFSDFRLDYYSDIHNEKYGTSPRAHMREIFEYCKSYAESFSPASDNILMYGGVGLGKTFLCNCISSTLTAAGYNVIFQSAYNVFELISKNKFNYKAGYDPAPEKFYNCDLLILDDLGTEFITEYTVASLFDIMNHRLTMGKPLIINANLSLKDMEKRYSDRIVSRLLTFRHLLFLGSDIRAANFR